MAQRIINIGVADKGNGDPLRTAFDKVNTNFTEIYDALANGTDLSQVNSDWNSTTGVSLILNKPTIPADVSDLTDTNGILVQHPANKLLNGDYEVRLNIDGSITVPASTNIRGTNDLNIVSESEENFTGLFLNGNPLLGSAVLYANSTVTLRADANGTVKDWNFDKSGTITTPLLLPKTFTAVLDDAHMGTAIEFSNTNYWEFEVSFQVNPNGSVETQIGNNTPFIDNPGYNNNSYFVFTEADHGIPGYTFELGLDDVVQAGPAGWTTNLTASPPPEYPSTVTSLGAIKLTANDNSWTFGTTGVLTVPAVGGENLFIQGSEIGSTNSGIAVSATNNIVLGTDVLGTAKFWQFGTNGNLTLPQGGDIVDSNGQSVLGGGTIGPVQPYLELTNTPFIIQPVTFGEPVTVTAPINGQGATFDVVIGEGPVLDTLTIANAGTGYVVGQQYKIWHYNIGGNDLASDITFEVATVGESGELLAISSPAFAGVATNTPGTYTGVSIELTSSVRDEISPGVVLTRSLNQGLYNIVAETEYDNSNYTSPLNTEWNADGWDNLVGVGSRSFTTFRSALGGQVGNNVVSAELVMRDVTTDRYYKFDFSAWGQNNGGSYIYTRTEITDPNFFAKTASGSEVDVIIADDGEGSGIGITRDTNYDGIYNAYREGQWDSNISPGGTTWNIEGWDDLSDVTTRVYTTFNTAYSGNFGATVPGSKAVMYVEDNDTYYAVEWLDWADDGTGAFSYVRYELDLTKLNEGIRFPDGSVLKSAEGVGRVKSTASAGRRIEEVVGSNQVSVTAVTTTNITATASRTVEGDSRFWVSTTSEIFAVIDNPSSFNIQDYATIQFSLDNVTWYTYNGGYSSTAEEIGVDCVGGPFTYNQGDTIYFRYEGGGAPQVWWNKNDLPGGGANFRGAVIDYHAYTGEGTFIGTIHIVDDSGEEHISHTEVASGSTDSENDDLWLVQNEGTISYRRIDGESKTLKIHWTAKVFYGTEFWD